MASASGLSTIPKVTKLSTRVVRILGCNPGTMTLQGTNTYMIGTGKRRLLIDTGDGRQPQYILNLKKCLNLDNAGLESLVLTHRHLDHVGGVQEVLKFSKGAKVFKFPRLDRGPEVDDATVVEVEFLPVEDGHIFEVEGATLTAHHTPGHTSDHIVLHLKEENAVFSGDCVLGEGTAVFEDLHDYMLSLRKILHLNPDVIYPGHGPVVRSPGSKVEEYIAHRNLRETQILHALKEDAGMTPEEIVKVVYSETPEALHVAAAINVSHHLKKLLKEARVSKAEGELYIRRAQ